MTEKPTTPDELGAAHGSALSDTERLAEIRAEALSETYGGNSRFAGLMTAIDTIGFDTECEAMSCEDYVADLLGLYCFVTHKGYDY